MATKKRIHAFSNDILGYYDATGIAELIRKKKAKPSEVAKAVIKRAKKIDKNIHGIETKGFEKAVKEANAHTEGFFAGVPTFIKDNVFIEGFPTNQGSQTIDSAPAKKTEPMVQQIMAQGFLCMGKSALPEYGFNATTEHSHKPPCRNPWNSDFSAGGSSGGAAALVASGVVPIAHGNDGGGSIRIPAACCGLIGLKPTRGRLINSITSRSLPINIVADSVLTRSVRDTAYFYAEAEKYYRNKKLPEIGLVEGPSKRRLRIGFLIDSITGTATDDDTRETVENTVTLLRNLGHKIRLIDIPAKKSFLYDFMYYWSMLAFFISILGKFIIDSSFEAEKFNDFTKGLCRLYKMNFYRTPQFLYRLWRSHAQANSYFKQENLDLVLTPVVGHTTPKIGYLSPEVPFKEFQQRLIKYVNFTPYANTSGLPGISLPMGITRDNLPIGVQFMATHGDERTLLELAYELERAQPWPKIYRKK